jgi:hypothetical protein
MKSPTAITALYGINASLSFVLSRERFAVYVVNSLRTICINSPVRASNVISLTIPSLLPSLVTTCFPRRALNGFLSIGCLNVNSL